MGGYQKIFSELGFYYDEINSGVIGTIAAIGFLIGMVQCLFGFKLMKFWITVQGFLFGGIIGLFIGPLTGHYDQEIILFIIIGAVVGALIAFKLYKIGVFLTAFVSGFLFLALLMFLSNPRLAVIFGIIGGIALGIIAVILIQPVFIISTSVMGGMQAGVYLGLLLKTDYGIGLVLGFICTGIGLYVQIKMNGGLTEHKKVKQNVNPAYFNNYNSNNYNPNNNNPNNYYPNNNNPNNNNPNNYYPNNNNPNNNNPNNYYPNNNNLNNSNPNNYYQNNNNPNNNNPNNNNQNNNNPNNINPNNNNPNDINPNNINQYSNSPSNTGTDSVNSEKVVFIRCAQCGTLCEENSRFCPNCGKELNPQQYNVQKPVTEPLTNNSADTE